MISGPSGTGKSSILRILCGLWDPISGEVILRGIENLFFLPQNPYLTKGSLKENILFPKYVKGGESIDDVVTDEKLEEVMELANIKYLVERLNNKNSRQNIDWDQEISLGEMQRVAMARLFFHKPEWAVLDECTSALDSESERIVYSNAKKMNITFISIAHRKSVMEFHENLLVISPSKNAKKGSSFYFRKIKERDYKKDKIEWKLIDSHISEKKSQSEMIDKDTILNNGLENDLEKNDSNIGNTGVNLKFIKRLFTLFKKKIIVASFSDWILVFTLVIFSVLCAVSPISIVLLAPMLLGKAMERDVKVSIIITAILFCSYFLVAILSAISLYFSSLQGIMMRNNMTKKIHSIYFYNKNFYKLNKIDKSIDNTDQRICSDIDLLTNGFESIFGIPVMEYLAVSSIVQGVLFITIAFVNAGVTMGALAIIMLLVVGTIQIIFMQIISKLRFIQQKREGYFRFSITRMKVYSEQICFYNAAEIEKKKIKKKFESVLKNQIILYLINAVSYNINQFYTFVTQLLSLLSMLISIYLNLIDLSQMKSSEIMQFIQSNNGTIESIAYRTLPILLVIMKLSDTVGLVARYSEMNEKLVEIENWKTYEENRKNGYNHVKCEKLDVITPGDGKKLISDLSFKIGEGDSLIIQGPSGCGKSSLLRTIGGLWDVKKGKITAPKKIGNDGIFFLPQKVYLILGTLKEQIIYPDKESKVSDEELLEILEKVNLKYIFTRLGKNLNTVKEWSSILSPGEQQRVCFARLLYHKPKFAFLDESTSSLDEDNEKVCYEVCKKERISCISVGHRETVVPFHERLLLLDKKQNWKLYQKEKDI